MGSPNRNLLKPNKSRPASKIPYEQERTESAPTLIATSRPKNFITPTDKHSTRHTTRTIYTRSANHIIILPTTALSQTKSANRTNGDSLHTPTRRIRNIKSIGSRTKTLRPKKDGYQ